MKFGFTSTSFRNIKDVKKIVDIAVSAGADCIEWGSDVHVKDIETAKAVIQQLVDCIFELKRDFSRQLNNLSSQNVKTLDFNVTQVKNIEKVLPKKEG